MPAALGSCFHGATGCLALSKLSDLGLGIHVSVTGEKTRARGCQTVGRAELLYKFIITHTTNTGLYYICIPKVCIHFINYTDFQKITYCLKISLKKTHSTFCLVSGITVLIFLCNVRQEPALSGLPGQDRGCRGSVAQSLDRIERAGEGQRSGEGFARPH